MAIPKLESYPLPRASTFPRNAVDWRVDRTRAVLLVHDMQDYFLDFYGEGSPLVAELVEAIGSLRAWCRASGVPVVYTAQPTEQSREDRGLLTEFWGKGIDSRPELKDIHAALAPTDGDVVLTKWRYSAFQRSLLAELMRDWRRDQLVICGVYAHIGCLMTAANAFQLDIRPFLVGDAVADFSLADHEMALRYTATRCGAVTSVKDVVAS